MGLGKSLGFNGFRVLVSRLRFNLAIGQVIGPIGCLG